MTAAEAGRRQDELAGDDADEGVADRELDAGEEMRRRRRQLQPQRGGDACPCGAPAPPWSSTRGTRSSPFSVAMIIATMAVATPISTIGIDRKAEDHDHHRIEDEDRHRVIGGEERIERLPHARQRVNDERRAQSRHHRDHAATMTMPNVRAICSLAWPEISRRTSATAISEGGITTRWSIRPTRQDNSSSPIAIAMTASLIQPTRRHPAAIPAMTERFHRTRRAGCPTAGR